MSPKVAVVFPGQGSQSVGMADKLVSAYPSARALFERAASVLGYDLFAITHDGPDEALLDTRVSQPAIFVTNYALATAIGDRLSPIAGAGHSFGEYCALTLAGVLDFEAALGLVRARAEAMGRAADAMPGAMSAVLGLDATRLRCIVDEVRAEPGVRVRLANFNAPTQIVISGDRRGVERAGALAAAAGAKRVVPLNVSGAWHSELMQPAREEFASELRAAALRPSSFPVVSNVDARIYADVEQIRDALERSVTDEVRWHDTALAILDCKPDLIVEFGAGKVLTPLIKRLDSAPDVMHVGDPKGLEALHHLLGEA